MKPIQTKLWIFLIAALLVGCGSGEQGKEASDMKGSKKSEKKTKEKKTKKMEKKDHLLPSTLQIASILNKSGLEYKNGVVNDPGKSSKYVTSTGKKLNFGVYSADMAYCVVNNQKDQALKQMKAVKELANDLGLSSIFNTEELAKRFEENLHNQDSLLSVLINIQENYDKYVQENGEGSLKVITYAGGWIESMHLGTKSHKKNDKVAQHLVEQMTILENIIGELETRVKNKTPLKDLISDLKDLQTTWEGFLEEKDDGTDPWAMELSDDQLSQLAQKIESIREKITKP